MKIFKICFIFILNVFVSTSNAFTNEDKDIKIWNISVQTTLGEENIDRTFYLFYPDTISLVQVFIPNLVLHSEDEQIDVEFPSNNNPFADKDSLD